MKLHEHQELRMNLVGRYGAGQIQINNQSITAPCIVAPGYVHLQWIAGLSELSLDALEPIWPLEPRIVLLGAATVQGLALRALRTELAARNAALEVMDLGGACRTYNVLAQEDRAVVGLLFP